MNVYRYAIENSTSNEVRMEYSRTPTLVDSSPSVHAFSSQELPEITTNVLEI